MEKKNKSLGTIVLVVLLLIVTIVSIILATYAWSKYTKAGTGTASADVAKWNVTLDSANKEFYGTYSHVVSQKIAPGTSGSFQVSINPNDTQVCIAYQIALNNVTYTTVTGTQTNTIKHLKFFADAEHTNEIATNGTVNSALTGTIDLTGTNHNTAPAATATKTIYWVWPYDYDEASNIAAYTNLEADAEAYDKEDTKVGEGITAMNVTYEIKAWQVDPQSSNSTDDTNTTNKPNLP